MFNVEDPSKLWQLTPPPPFTLPTPATAAAAPAVDPKKEKLRKLLPLLLGALATYAATQKSGYGGAGVGQFAANLSGIQQQKKAEELQAQQTEEERKRYEWQKLLQGQAEARAANEAKYLDYTRAQDVSKETEAKQFGGWLGGELETLGAGTPGRPETPAQNYAWNLPGAMAHVTPEDRPVARTAQPGMPANVAAAPGAPGTPGDPKAAALAQMLAQSGFNPAIVQAALQYYMGTKEPRPPAREPGLVLQSVSPNNFYASQLLQPGLSNEEFDNWATKALDYEAKQGRTPEEIEKIRLELEILRKRSGLITAQTGAASRSNQPDDSSTKIDSKSLYQAIIALAPRYRGLADFDADLKQYGATLGGILGPALYEQLVLNTDNLRFGTQFKPGLGGPGPILTLLQQLKAKGAQIAW